MRVKTVLVLVVVGLTVVAVRHEDVARLIQTHAVASPPKPAAPVAGKPASLQIMRGSQIEKIEHRN